VQARRARKADQHVREHSPPSSAPRLPGPPPPHAKTFARRIYLFVAARSSSRPYRFRKSDSDAIASRTGGAIVLALWKNGSVVTRRNYRRNRDRLGIVACEVRNCKSLGRKRVHRIPLSGNILARARPAQAKGASVR
jgi:hypothetical protein